MSNFYAVIMAGGSGTRLWPLSRKNRPKQAIQLIDNRTMFQHAVDRLDTLLPLEQVFVVTAREHIEILARQVPSIPSENYVVEPMARGTAGAIGLAAVYLGHRDPQGVMAVLTADHYIRDVDKFRRVLSAAAHVASEGHLVTLGIEPNFASTGFGYVRRGERLQQLDGFDVWEVASFREKPDAETAAEYLASGLYSWNSGMFIWRVDRIMDEFERHMPGLYGQLQTIEAALDTPDETRVLAEVWPQVRQETIDFGIMEKADDMVVIPVDIGWTDIGDWAAIYPLHQADDKGNVAVGTEHVAVNSSGVFVLGQKKLIATVGLQDVIIIETGDAILVCARDQAQQVRQVVRQLNEAEKDEYL